MDQELGFLGASPDGIVRGKTDVGLLEIKCPLSSDSVSELAAGRGFCLEATAKGLQLKRSHAYYSQVQMQLAVTQMKWADFVVFTSNGSSSSMHVERVHYDDGFWQQALEKVITFYKKFVSIKPFQHTSRRKKSLTLGRKKEKFRQRNWGSNPGPLALRTSALTTELSRHSRELR